MERIKSLDRYQKGLLIIITVMVFVFTVVYPVIITSVGFEYKNTILIPNKENGNTIYSGKIQGKQVSFTVSADKSVEFKYGDKTYGPYTAKEDSTAIPKDSEMSEFMTGVELRCGDEIIFRGAVLNLGDYRHLYNEDGSLENIEISFETNYGVTMDENGNVIDPMKPSVSTILDLMNNPELTHKGEWFAWFCAVFICILNAISILFVGDLFRFNLSFRIRDVERVEPSDWVIACRYIGWSVSLIAAAILFIIGLQ